MYVAPPFRPQDDTPKLDLIDANPFGMLVSRHEGRLVATHLPMLLVRRTPRPVLEGHLARANPQWRELRGQEVLAVFTGPHAHVSPTWYATTPAVPTWDYTAVHAYGQVEIVDDPDELLAMVERLSARYEDRWRLADQPEAYRRTMIKGTMGFRLAVERLEASFKLSQNRPAADRIGVVRGLRARARGDDAAVADLVERFAPADR